MLFFQLGHGVLDRIRQAVAPRAPVIIHQQVARDAGQPRGECAVGRPVAGQGAIDAQKNFLAEVLGFRGVAGEPVAQVKNAPRVAPHKLLPGRPFAPEASLHQLGVGLQAFLASRFAFPFSLTRCNAILGQKVPFPRLRDGRTDRGSAGSHTVPHLIQLGGGNTSAVMNSRGGETNAKGCLDTFRSLLLRCEINAAQFTKAAPAAARRGRRGLFILQVPQFHHPGRISLVHGRAIAAGCAAFFTAAHHGHGLRVFRDSVFALDALFADARPDAFLERLSGDAHGLYLHILAGPRRRTHSTCSDREEGRAFHSAHVRRLRAGARFRHHRDGRHCRVRTACHSSGAVW